MKLVCSAFAAVVVLSACGSSTSTTSAAQSTTGPTAVPSVATPTEPAIEPTPSAVPPSPTAAPEPTATPSPMLEISISGLPDLTGDSSYEAWVVVDGQPTSAGTFSTGAGAVLAGPAEAGASAVIITIESDDDPAPADTHVLAGPIVDGIAELSVADSAALGTTFDEASGGYILATPTDGTVTGTVNERSGVWWTLIPRAQSLFLPTLPAGWIYEGWQIIDGVPISTGTFIEPFGSPDDAAPFSGPETGPPLVGEDFLMNAPDGLSFPVDLRGTEIAITVEPVPDTSADPFPIKPIGGTVPADAVDHVVYAASNTADSLPTGTARLSVS